MHVKGCNHNTGVLQRGVRENRGHLRDPHIKVNLLTYFAHGLLDSRVLAVENGGAAALRGDTPAYWGHGDPVARGCGRARVKQGKGVGRRITARGELERSGHVAGDLCELRRGGVHDGVGIVTSPVLG